MGPSLIWKRIFEEGGGEILSVGTQLSIRAPICDGGFPARLIEQSISHHKWGGLSKSRWNFILQHSKQAVRKDFYVETQIEKKTQGEERERERDRNIFVVRVNFVVSVFTNSWIRSPLS